MGVLPLEFTNGENSVKLGLDVTEEYSISGIADDLKPGKTLRVVARDGSGNEKTFDGRARIDTPVEIQYYKNGGILQYVLRKIAG